MDIKLIDFVIFGSCLVVGLMIGDGIGSRVNNVDNSISENAKKIERMEVMAAEIDLKMGLILEKVKKLEDHE